jgi:hypothetical protein
MSKRKKTQPPSALKEFWERHLPYEIDMLRELYPELTGRRNTQLIHNAVVESFHTHARNLIEFFVMANNCNFDPRWFTNGFNINQKFIKDTLVHKINQQISHLTAKRTKVGDDQLGEPQWEEIKNSIEGEISRFEAALSTSNKVTWKPLQPTHIKTGVGTGASSEIRAIGPQSVTSLVKPLKIVSFDKPA